MRQLHIILVLCGACVGALAFAVVVAITDAVREGNSVEYRRITKERDDYSTKFFDCRMLLDYETRSQRPSSDRPLPMEL